ncbi:unnamed protein product [Rotaria sp. Silwood1]|nr:unnamed protein product [Rotaria sp. Silwood1]
MQSLFILNSSKIINSNIRLSSSSIKPSIISRIRNIIHHYWLGSKLLYQNYKSVQQIRKKDINSLTRHEYLTLEQFHYDIRVGAPFVLLFLLPIIGYSAPIIAFIAPKYLPSTLIMPKQKAAFIKDDARASSLIIDSLIEFSQKQYNYENIHGIISIMQFIDQVSKSSDRFKMLMSSIPLYSSLFTKYINLSLLDRKHLLLIHKSVLHSSFIADYILTNYSIEYDLEMWQHRILIDDKRIINVNKLSQYELVSSLYSRGIYLHVNHMGKVLQYEQMNNLNKFEKKKSKNLNEYINIDEYIINDWKELLHKWIQIHDQVSKTNRISTSFLVHITPLLVN